MKLWTKKEAFGLHLLFLLKCYGTVKIKYKDVPYTFFGGGRRFFRVKIYFTQLILVVKESDQIIFRAGYSFRNGHQMSLLN